MPIVFELSGSDHPIRKQFSDYAGKTLTIGRTGTLTFAYYFMVRPNLWRWVGCISWSEIPGTGFAETEVRTLLGLRYDTLLVGMGVVEPAMPAPRRRGRTRQTELSIAPQMLLHPQAEQTDASQMHP